MIRRRNVWLIHIPSRSAAIIRHHRTHPADYGVNQGRGPRPRLSGTPATHRRLRRSCAGDGAAVFDLSAAVWGTPLQRATGPAVAIYAVEAEQERARALAAAPRHLRLPADKHVLMAIAFA